MEMKTANSTFPYFHETKIRSKQKLRWGVGEHTDERTAPRTEHWRAMSSLKTFRPISSLIELYSRHVRRGTLLLDSKNVDLFFDDCLLYERVVFSSAYTMPTTKSSRTAKIFLVIAWISGVFALICAFGTLGFLIAAEFDKDLSSESVLVMSVGGSCTIVSSLVCCIFVVVWYTCVKKSRKEERRLRLSYGSTDVISDMTPAKAQPVPFQRQQNSNEQVKKPSNEPIRKEARKQQKRWTDSSSTEKISRVVFGRNNVSTVSKVSNCDPPTVSNINAPSVSHVSVNADMLTRDETRTEYRNDL
uniref:Uncharacterized protein n=1 Tax=Steinernema glaseri TaxID=37863 RepID=A0A1I8AQS7_9BILA